MANSDKDDKKICRLTEIDTRAIGIVDRGANGRRLLVVKKDEKMDIEPIENKEENQPSDNDLDMQDEKDFIEKAGAKMSAKRRTAFKNAVETLMSILKEIVPEEPIDSVKKSNKSSDDDENLKINDEMLGEVLKKVLDENQILRSEISKIRNHVSGSMVGIVENLAGGGHVGSGNDESVEWPMDFNE